MNTGVAKKKIVRALVRLGFRKSARSKGCHVWINDHGMAIHPRLRQKTVPFNYLYCLGSELEVKRACSRQRFVQLVRCC